MKYTVNRRPSIVLMFLSFLLLSIIAVSNSPAAEEYVFERMWPTLQQPWYFSDPKGIAVDGNSNVYVSDMHNSEIQKISASGAFITKWGGEGVSNGEFKGPSRLAVDSKGNVYVLDSGNYRVQKFTSSGTFITKWGREGSADGEFSYPVDIEIGLEGNIYVSDGHNNRIQKFTSSGDFITSWGTFGTGDGEFSFSSSIAIDGKGNVYVADVGNHRIQKFTSSGKFITKWGREGSADGEFSYPDGVAADADGNVYVADYYRIQKFNSSGSFLTKWGRQGTGNGEFDYISDLSVDDAGNLYVTDFGNARIQKFSSSGTFVVKWGSSGFVSGKFIFPRDVVLNDSGNVYAVDSYNNRIQKFDSSGTFIRSWGKKGTGDGEFMYPSGVAIDNSENIYVGDERNKRIQKFNSSGVFLMSWEIDTDGEWNDRSALAVDGGGNVYVALYGYGEIHKFNSSGDFILKWGSYGSGDGELAGPAGIAIDSSGNIYVAEEYNHRVQKFTSTGEFLTKWGQEGSDNGSFFLPHGIAVDSAGNVYVADEWNDRIQKFTGDGSFVTAFGTSGSVPGQLRNPSGIAVDSEGRIYTVDTRNNRIQVFKQKSTGSNNKAIILAGGGAYDGNNLWNATMMCANFAYRTLTYQGYTKESIYYLTSDTDLDLDNNGVLDDVDADATNRNLQKAITDWAADADGVLLYLVDHGGNGTFRMSGTETLSAADLNSWLDSLQAKMPGKVTFIYDACNSGSFLQTLNKPTAGLERIVITSTSPDENAKFVTQGSVSFSNYFWSDIFNGFSIKDAFQGTQQALKASFDDQNPLLDANGNGLANEPDDFELTRNAYIGNGTVITGNAPEIGTISPPETISGSNSASLYADQVTDSDGIGRVWAVIRPPDYVQGSADNPVTSLPSIDLMPVGNDRYEATFKEFNIAGTYQIAIYAMDGIGNTAVPQLTTVSVENPLRRRAVIVAGGPSSSPIWQSIEKNAKEAHEALCFQGYTDDDIYFLSPITFSTGVDGTPTLSNLSHALGTWAETDTQDLVLYMIGNGETGVFDLNETESVSATDLDDWLDDLQQQISGKVTVIYDAAFSGSFLPLLTPPAGLERIFIASTSDLESPYFLSDENVCFSNYFWSRIYNGSRVRDAFLHGKQAMAFDGHGQVAQMDDNGNGIGNEKNDGELAGNYTIGAGIMLGGDDPVIGSVSPPQTIGGTSATIWARDVTTTGEIKKVWAVIMPQGYTGSASNATTPLPTLELTGSGSHYYEGTYGNFTVSGTYQVVVFAMDAEGTVSLPAQTAVTVFLGCLAVSSDLSIQLSCATYNGNSYGFTLAFYPNPGDPSGFYWKLVISTLTNGTGSYFIPIGADLSIPMDCVSYNGTQYGFTLRFYPNPYDPSGLYWVMDKSTLTVK